MTRTLETTLLRQQALEADNARLASENAAFRAHLETGGTAAQLVLENAELRAKVAELTETCEILHFRMTQMTRRLFGSTSERHHPDQQALDEIMRHVLVENALVPDETVPLDATASKDVTEPAAAASSADAAVTPDCGQPETGSARERKKGRGRLVLPDHLPIEDRRIEVPESERLGPDGIPLPEVGAEITIKLHLEPAKLMRLRIIRPVYKKPFSEEPRIIAPPLACVVPHGLPTDETVAMVLVEKFDFHMPLYRQETKLERAGVDLSRATLMNWVRHGAEFLAPIHRAIGASIRTSPVIGLDDTWIDVLDPGAGETHESRLWGYLADDEFYCEYRRSRAGAWPAEFLAGYTGTAVADAFAGHKQLFVSGTITWAACMAHARRKFDEALKAGEMPATAALDLFSLLWRLEDEIRHDSPEQRREGGHLRPRRIGEQHLGDDFLFRDEECGSDAQEQWDQQQETSHWLSLMCLSAFGR